jgi:hypothetical protein
MQGRLMSRSSFKTENLCVPDLYARPGLADQSMDKSHITGRRPRPNVLLGRQQRQAASKSQTTVSRCSGSQTHVVIAKAARVSKFEVESF